MVLCHQGGSEAVHIGGVQHFTDLGTTKKQEESVGENPLYVKMLCCAETFYTFLQ